MDLVTPQLLSGVGVPAQLYGSISIKPALRVYIGATQLLGYYFGYHTSFLGVPAFRHSFSEIQLCRPSFLGSSAL